MVDIDPEQLGLETSDQLQVRVGDARVGCEEAGGRRDLVVGDAFGGLSVPWQLTTVEAMGWSTPPSTADGVYAVNLIDHPPLAFVRAELATLRRCSRTSSCSPGRRCWPARTAATSSPSPPGRRCPATRISAALAGQELAWQVADGAELDAFIGDADVLTDDFAPVDQLLNPYG